MLDVMPDSNQEFLDFLIDLLFLLFIYCLTPPARGVFDFYQILKNMRRINQVGVLSSWSTDKIVGYF